MFLLAAMLPGMTACGRVPACTVYGGGVDIALDLALDTR